VSDIIGILNYGIIGNIYNIEKVLNKLHTKYLIINNKNDFKKVDKLILPGVGTFEDAIKELHQNDMFDTLIASIKTKPTLGICLGMQILSSLGFENKETVGLDIIKATVNKLDTKLLLPHLGFNTIECNNDNELFKGIIDKEFYFMHSFEVNTDENILATSTYGKYKFVAAIQKERVFGVQFHPEKSRESGIKLLNNFITL